VDAAVGPRSHHLTCVGPFDKTLTCDASPLAEPLLGSGAVDFGVPVYSKAAALMVMMSHYAAAAAAAAADSAESSNATETHQSGPVEGLMGSTPPSTLREVLRQHLQQHAYGSATAQDTLQRIISLSPEEVSDNALAVIMGWHNPGSPLIDLQPTGEVSRADNHHTRCWRLNIRQEGMLCGRAEHKSAGLHVPGFYHRT